MRKNVQLPALCIAVAALVAACANPPLRVSDIGSLPPEAASGYRSKPGWATQRFAVAAANPLATDAGYDILRAGGNAIDAAIAVQLVLGLVEPQSSGIAGGAFLLYYDGRTVEAFDGRETAPAAADESLFLKPDGKPMAFYDGLVGGRSVGTPGAIRMLEMAHSEHGRLPWASLFEPAIRMADEGFIVSPRLAMLLAGEIHLKKDPAGAAFFYPGGKALQAGTRLRNPAYAEVLRKIAREGSRGLLEGSVARAIVAKVNSHPTNPGKLSMSDLAGYQAKKRTPICSDYSAKSLVGAVHEYRLCGMPPPSSGAIAVAQILGILAATNAHALPLAAGREPALGPTPSADFLHLYTEASRLAFADRAQYLGDPDFVEPPAGGWSSLIEPAYLRARARAIAAGPEGQSMKSAKPGIPGPLRTSYAPMPDQPEYGTSHLSIVDASGHAVSMTTTIENQFGARLLTDGGTNKPGGFLLNNELTDFSYVPMDAEGRLVANRVQGNKRPRSSMAPTLVFEKGPNGSNGPLVLTAGSPGGAMIIHFNAKTLYGMLNWGMNAQQAINVPNFGSTNGPSLLEAGRFSPQTIEALRKRGAEVVEQELTSGAQAIQKTRNGYFGGADPRREGIVRGD